MAILLALWVSFRVQSLSEYHIRETCVQVPVPRYVWLFVLGNDLDPRRRRQYSALGNNDGEGMVDVVASNNASGPAHGSERYCFV